MVTFRSILIVLAAILLSTNALAHEKSSVVAIIQDAELRKGNKVVGNIQAGNVYRVHERRGTWHKLETDDGPLDGWIEGNRLFTYRNAETRLSNWVQRNPRNANARIARGNLWSNVPRQIVVAGWQADGRNMNTYWQWSLDSYDEAIRLAPRSDYAYQQRGLLRYRKRWGKTQIALADFEQAIRLNPKNYVCLTERGFIACEIAKYKQALVDFEAALVLKPEYQRAQSGVDICREQLGVNVSVRKAPLATSNGWEALKWAWQAEGLLAAEKYHRVIKEATEMLASTNAKTKPSIYLIRGRAHLRNKKHTAAIADFARVARLSPQNASTYKLLGDALEGNKEYELAFRAYRKATDLKPNYFDAYVVWAKLASRRGKEDQVVQVWSDAIEENTSRARYYYERSKAYSASRQYSLGLADISRAIKLEPDSAVLLCERAAIWRAKGKTNLAITDLTAAIELDGEYYSAWFDRAEIYSDLGDNHSAIAGYTEAIENKRLRMKSLEGRSIAYARLGKTDLALADVTAATKEIQGHLDIHLEAMVWLEANKPHKAIEVLSEFLNEGNECWAVNCERSLAWRQLKNYAGTKADLDRAVVGDNLHLRVDAFLELSWLLATCPEKSVRDAKRARIIVEQAMHYIDENPILETKRRDAKLCLCCSNAEAGDVRAARKAFLEAAALSPYRIESMSEVVARLKKQRPYRTSLSLAEFLAKK